MIIDAHCHISTDFDGTEIDQLYQKCSQNDIRLILMSTNHIDYQYVDKLGELENITPCFGIHPWYSHLFSDDINVSKKDHYSKVFGKEVNDEVLQILPNPINLDEHLTKLNKLIKKHLRNGSKVCIGEIGYDKLFKIPTSGYYGNPKFKGLDVKLTNYKTSVKHQEFVFSKTIKLAVENNLSMSLHNVKSGGVVYDSLKRELNEEYTGCICLHSYTGSLETLGLFLKKYKNRFFVSLSSYINEQKSEELQWIIKVMPIGNVLTESDMCIDRVDIIEQIQSINRVVSNEEQLIDNYHRFVS